MPVPIDISSWTPFAQALFAIITALIIGGATVLARKQKPPPEISLSVIETAIRRDLGAAIAAMKESFDQRIGNSESLHSAAMRSVVGNQEKADDRLRQVEAMAIRAEENIKTLFLRWK